MTSTESSSPVTELALFHLKSSADRVTIRKELLSAAKAQASYSKYPTYLFTQIEDPSYIYLLGGWSSVSAHMDDWIPSSTNQSLLASLKEKLDLVYMVHIEIDPAVLGMFGLPAGSSGEVPIIDAPVIAIGRYFLKAGQKEAFLNKFEETKRHLQAYIAPRGFKGGVRAEPKEKSDDGEHKEEFVLFSGWGEVQDHFRFAESDGFKEFSRIRDFLEGAEIKHVSVWEDRE
ncbi:hypothetical protein BDV38DRAFT_234176 [Aspergillus pseudotamarii]|uniref:ABM domain-containing protein n=1 Tax=Aspergillus pseudotamarii TaxID=132259 RepID=A0A5N6T9L0_ASPPS|nr:uncharacterized protein BDV38DRAFT_234176 [Aspergillus pseudotamarii]KAE8142869.1 hypothetical protein BDV38DRAFT_234176 [Aspergillus pseudotamarii]